ncbi:MAG: Uma2 family endonuclease [Chloroflexota bacterium]|nr:Uma2 family endonuclease [Chloroflexota bacterium]
MTPSPVPLHQRASSRVHVRFAQQALAGDLRESFYAPIDVVFAPNVVAVPEVVFVARDHLHIVGPKAINGVPDLIVEILSPSTRRRDLGSKKALYERFGVPEYWTVDLRRHVLTACVLADGRYRCLDLADGVARSEAVPGLEVDVTALFAGL